MGDLDRLRHRLWLAVIVGTVGCDDGSKARTTSEMQGPSGNAAGESQGPADPKPSAEGGAPSGAGGISAIVDAAVLDAEGRKYDLPPPKPTVDAHEVCSVVVDKTTALDGRSARASDRLGCPHSADPPPGTSSRFRLSLSIADTQRLRDGGDTDNCCYVTIRPPVKGRPYRVDGSLRLPEFTLGRRTATPTVDHARTRRAAAGWLRDAREELASVAAFERAALELTAVGAPKPLVDACAVAAAQERRHAALCLEVARHFAARPIHLGPGPPVSARAPSLPRVLLDTFEEGCVGETIAAAIAQRSRRGAAPTVQHALQTIADDETEHAALAWRTVAWGLSRLTATQRRCFFAEAHARLGRARPKGTARPNAPLHGRLSPAAQADVAADVIAHIVRPLLSDLQRRREPEPRAAVPGSAPGGRALRAT